MVHGISYPRFHRGGLEALHGPNFLDLYDLQKTSHLRTTLPQCTYKSSINNYGGYTPHAEQELRVLDPSLQRNLQRSRVVECTGGSGEPPIESALNLLSRYLLYPCIY